MKVVGNGVPGSMSWYNLIRAIYLRGRGKELYTEIARMECQGGKYELVLGYLKEGEGWVYTRRSNTHGVPGRRV